MSKGVRVEVLSAILDIIIKERKCLGIKKDVGINQDEYNALIKAVSDLLQDKPSWK